MQGHCPQAQVRIPAAQLAEGAVIEGWLTLMNEEGTKPMKDRHHQEGTINVVIQYQNVLQVHLLRPRMPNERWYPVVSDHVACHSFAQTQ